MKLTVKDIALEEWGNITYTIIYMENKIKCSIMHNTIQIDKIENIHIPKKVYDLSHKFGYMIQKKITQLIKEHLSIYEETDIGCKYNKLKSKNNPNFIYSVSDEVNWIVNNNPLKMLEFSVNA